jgi:hypothetical protein
MPRKTASFAEPEAEETESPMHEPEEEVREPRPVVPKRKYTMTPERREQLLPILAKGRAVLAEKNAARRVEREAATKAATETKLVKAAERVVRHVAKTTKKAISMAVADEESDGEVQAPRAAPARRKVVELDDDDSADEIVVKRKARKPVSRQPFADSPAPAAPPAAGPPRSASAGRARPSIVFY